MTIQIKKRAPLNRTLIISEKEMAGYEKLLLRLSRLSNLKEITNKIINQDLSKTIDFLPEKFVDLLFIDPPYNLSKNFSSIKFKEMKSEEYEKYIDSWLAKLVKVS